MGTRMHFYRRKKCSTYSVRSSWHCKPCTNSGYCTGISSHIMSFWWKTCKLSLEILASPKYFPHRSRVPQPLLERRTTIRLRCAKGRGMIRSPTFGLSGSCSSKCAPSSTRSKAKITASWSSRSRHLSITMFQLSTQNRFTNLSADYFRKRQPIDQALSRSWYIRASLQPSRGSCKKTRASKTIKWNKVIYKLKKLGHKHLSQVPKSRKPSQKWSSRATSQLSRRNWTGMAVRKATMPV